MEASESTDVPSLQSSSDDALQDQTLFTGIYRQKTLDRIKEDDPDLDPRSDTFDPSKFGRKMHQAMDAQGISVPRIGVAFQNLSVSGSGAALQYQANVLSALASFSGLTKVFHHGSTVPKQVLEQFDGVLDPREMLLVLGRPGSGCTTFLKTLCGMNRGLVISKHSRIRYGKFSAEQMHKWFRGEIAYNAETEHHFPHLTVGQTLEFAAATRAPHVRVGGVSRQEYINTSVQVAMAVFGLSHTYNTKVGNDFVRGVSGGERKRVSIAEMALSRARIGLWDNSTRGLDAATALSFVRALRLSADIGGACHAVAAYQASQAIYDLFDKVIVLYTGREIFFGRRDRAVEYFQQMGWYKPDRQAAPDFLTAVTNPLERTARDGFADKVPRTPEEFQSYWQKSPDYRDLQRQLQSKLAADGEGNDSTKEPLAVAHRAQQAEHVRPESPYLISVPMQIRLCIRRSYQRLWNEKSSTVSTVCSQIVLSLIIGSIFYNTPDASAGFFSKGAVLFFAVLMNALIAINEITLLYSQRPIVEKQTAYAFVHPFAEALGNMIADLPIKLTRCTVFALILYFMVNLRRAPAQFFIFLLFLIVAILTMSSIFRTLAAATKTVGQAMALAGVMVIAIVVYAGFTLPQPYMHPWFSWLRWINPVFYAFEALIANEFHGRKLPCSQFVPSYADLTGKAFICSTPGSIAGERFVSGDRFIDLNYGYSYSHIWRNLGIVLAFWVFFTCTYLACSEFNTGTSSKAEYLVFRRGHAPSYLVKDSSAKPDEEKTKRAVATPGNGSDVEKYLGHLPPQTKVLTWHNLSYDIPVAGGTRRLLDEISGWVKPGQLTALMGVSGAGKTTLLDVLALRVSIGVVTGDVMVSGAPRGPDFSRKTGYVQQQDLHLDTTTVREALRFSAVLRQPNSVSKMEKYQYVEEVIKMLRMEEFAEAVVGRVGEGLNVEQRKLLTIGVELAAKPGLLVFLDEPTSGLDSQSSWSICQFLRTLADHGQAVLCTIHQPSALLFQQFDRLLFLAKGGKTVYFGDIGPDSRPLLDYFERNGAPSCAPSENPAEYMLEVVSGTRTQGKLDWPTIWKASPEAQAVQEEILRIQDSGSAQETEDPKAQNAEFAMPLSTQIVEVTGRTFAALFRTPEYIYAKLGLVVVSALFIGFSFWRPGSSQEGFQTVLFGCFLMCSIFSTLVNQVMPRFVSQRELYEVRERPSRTYSWKAFILAQLVSELPWQILAGVLGWLCFYWPIFGTGQTGDRRGLILLYLVQFYIFASSFAHLVISALPDAATGGMLATLCFGLTLIFNGVMQPPDALPGFWIFMWRVSPLTYYVGGLAATALHGRSIECSAVELNIFDPPTNITCGEYLARYLQVAPGTLLNPGATTDCRYCPMSSADQYLAQRRIFWGDRWRNYGIFWAYFVFNIFGAVLLYYLFRVKKWNMKRFHRH